MRTAFSLLLLSPTILCTAMLCAAGKEKPKPAIVELQDLKVTLEGDKVNIDGVVHNIGDHPIKQLVLAFQFFDTAHQPVTTLKMEIDEQIIDPDDDAEIHAQANEPPRSVSVEVSASARGEKELKVINPGPYQIE